MNPGIRRLAILLLLPAMPLRLGAQELTTRPFPVRDVESWSYKSASMGHTFSVLVGLPAGYAADPGKRWPTLIVTDGDWIFPLANDAARGLAGQGDTEGLIVISVGTPLEDGDSAWTRQRIFEFSPPNWPRTDPFGKGVTGYCQGFHSAPDRCTGGAPQFLDFIVRDLLPKVEAKYRIDTARLGLYGVSAGGFFASWVIFQPNSPFTTYIISSPAMAYGDGEVFRLEAQYASTHKDLAAGIFIASGSLEMDNPMLEGLGQIVSGQMRLSAALRSRNYPGLKLITEIHDGMGHSDNAGTSLNRGIRLLYAKHGDAP